MTTLPFRKVDRMSNVVSPTVAAPPSASEPRPGATPSLRDVRNSATQTLKPDHFTSASPSSTYTPETLEARVDRAHVAAPRVDVPWHPPKAPSSGPFAHTTHARRITAPTSQPYPDLPLAPKGWTLYDAFAATVDAAGRYHVGKLSFASAADFNDYKAAQQSLGGTPNQLAVLHDVIVTGRAPDAYRIAAAPAGTTVDSLLPTGKTPDAKGFYELGTLRVAKDEYGTFGALQRDLARRNPEALAALYHMEHAPDGPLTFRVTDDRDRNDRFEPATNTISWNPDTAIRDAYDGKRVAPDSAALHEETHWAGRRVGDVLAAIPDPKYTNLEEKRVIEGSEARDMQILGRGPRHSHYGSILPVDNIDSISPVLSVERQGVSRHVGASWRQSGHVVDENANGTTTLAIGGDARDPRSRLTFKTEELSWAMGGDLINARALLDDARTHGDSVTFAITNDGRMTYANPAQERRLHDRPEPGLSFPQPLRAVTVGR